MTSLRWLVLLAVCGGLLGTLPASADVSASRVQAALPQSSTERDAGDRAYFTDRFLLTQDGKPLRFYSDILKDKTVLIQFIYTQCREACPLTTQRLADTQSLLEGRLGRDIQFLSLTVVPAQDTPEHLKDYASRFKAGLGWLFLTGAKDDIDTVTHKLGQTSPVVEGHLPIFILGNVRTGHWMKLQPYSAPAVIARELLALADER